MSRSIRKETSSFAFGMVGRLGGSSAGFVVAALNAASATSREVVVLRVLSAGILCPLARLKLSVGKFHFEPPSCFTSLDHLVGEQKKRFRDRERSPWNMSASDHSSFIPAAFMIGHHFSISDFTSNPRNAGVCSDGGKISISRLASSR